MIDIDVVSLFELAPVSARKITRPVLEFSVPNGASEKTTTAKTTRVHVHYHAHAQAGSASPGPERGSLASGLGNVRILQRLRLEVDLPKKVAFSPNLTVRLIDDCKPVARIVGTGSIYLGQFLPWVKPQELLDGDAKRFIDEDDLEITHLEPVVLSDPEGLNSSSRSKKIEKEKQKEPEGEDAHQVPLDPVPLTPTIAQKPSRPKTINASTSSRRMMPSSSSGGDVVVDMMQDEEAGEKRPLLAPAPPAPQQQPEISVADLKQHLQRHITERTLPHVQEQAVGPADAPPEEPARPAPVKRQRLAGEMESVIRPPFLTCRLVRRRNALSRFFSGEERAESSAQDVDAGKLRGAVRVFVSDSSSAVPPLEALEAVMKPQEVVVRFYLIRGRNFVPKVRD